MTFGRFVPILSVLALAGSLAALFLGPLDRSLTSHLYA